MAVVVHGYPDGRSGKPWAPWWRWCMDSGPVGHLPMIVRMKHRPIIAALAIAGAAWALTLGTVAVVEFGRLVDAIAGAGIEAPPFSTDALAVPVQRFSASADAQAIAAALRSIAHAILAVD